jgi:hypothetical protein
MTIDLYITAGASIAAFLAALATFLTVWQIAKQRRATYSPEIVVMRARVITTGDVNDPSLISLLQWKRSEEDQETQRRVLGRDYPLFLANIGMGAATGISALWDFPMGAFVAYVRRLENSRGYPVDVEFNKGTLSVTRPPIASFWTNQLTEHFDYILPTSIEKEPTRIMLPLSYILVVSVCMSVFVRELKDEEKGPEVPPLKLSLEFNDIAGKKHRRSYNIEFHWQLGTPYAFEAELVPRRV